MELIYHGSANKGGVYKITNKQTGKFYIGSAKNFKKRSYQHVSSLENGKYQNKHLQAAFRKDGSNNFIFEVIEIVEGNRTQRTKKEQEYLD